MEEGKKHFINVSDVIKFTDHSEKKDINIAVPTAKIKLEFGNVIFKIEKTPYLLFYREFYRNFIRIKNSPKSEVGNDFLILSGLFMHLTFESLITSTIRSVLNMAYKRKNQSIKKIWDNIFETQFLDKKIEFLENSIIEHSEENNVRITNIKKFVKNKLNPLRNGIVHGHEISKTSDTKIDIKSRLSGLLSEENIREIYDAFWANIEGFLDLFNSLIIPSEVNLAPDFIPKQIIQNPKDALKKIEKEVEEELKVI